MSRGLRRVSIGLALLWFVFWTVTYVATAHQSEMLPQASSFTVMTGLLLLAALLIGLPWIVSGFRSEEH